MDTGFTAWLKATINEQATRVVERWVRKPTGPNPWFRVGTVAADYTSGLPSVTLDGEDVAAQYHYLSSYTPAASDRVFLARSGNTWEILGKIV